MSAISGSLALTLVPSVQAGEPREFVELLPPLQHHWTSDDVLSVLETASPQVQCVIQYEIGGVGFEPYAVGADGELGPAQLHPAGKLPEFRRLGYTDPFSPYQSVRYLEDALNRDQGWAWSPIALGLCP